MTMLSLCWSCLVLSSMIITSQVMQDRTTQSHEMSSTWAPVMAYLMHLSSRNTCMLTATGLIARSNKWQLCRWTAYSQVDILGKFKGFLWSEHLVLPGKALSLWQPATCEAIHSIRSALSSCQGRDLATAAVRSLAECPVSWSPSWQKRHRTLFPFRICFHADSSCFQTESPCFRMIPWRWQQSLHGGHRERESLPRVVACKLSDAADEDGGWWDVCKEQDGLWLQLLQSPHWPLSSPGHQHESRSWAMSRLDQRSLRIIPTQSLRNHGRVLANFVPNSATFRSIWHQQLAKLCNRRHWAMQMEKRLLVI